MSRISHTISLLLPVSADSQMNVSVMGAPEFTYNVTLVNVTSLGDETSPQTSFISLSLLMAGIIAARFGEWFICHAVRYCHTRRLSYRLIAIPTISY